MSLTLITTALKVTVLVITGCTGTDPNSDSLGHCPESVGAESWQGVFSDSECEAFIRTKQFDPEDYLPGYGSYIVNCKPQTSTL